MAVQLFKEREAPVFNWTEGLDYEGKIRIKTSTVEHPEQVVSETVLESNQGFAAVTFPAGEVVDFYVKVFSEPEGELLDEGTVEV